MHPLVNIAVRAARSAGDIIIRNMDRLDRLKVATKQNNDFVSNVDHMAEQAIIDTIKHAYPDHAQLTENDLRYDDGLAVLMTEKDAVKCKGISVDACWYVPVEVEVEQPQDWLDDLCRRLSMKTASEES